MARREQRNMFHLLSIYKKIVSSEKIDTQDLDSSVGKKSQGFNGFIIHDDQGDEYQVQFDWQNGYRLQAGRAKKTSVSVDLGKYDADPTMSVARIELVKDGEVLSSDVKTYKDVGTKFSIVLENNDGEILCWIKGRVRKND